MRNQPTCLCCLTVEGRLFPMNKVNAIDLYMDAVGLSVVLGEHLPQFVCYYCLHTLRKFSRFRMRCRTVLDLLTRLLQTDSQGIIEFNQSLISVCQQLKPQYMKTKTITLEICNSDNYNDDDFNPSPENTVDDKEQIFGDLSPLLQQDTDVKMELVAKLEDDLNNPDPLDGTECQYLEEEYLEDVDLNVDDTNQNVDESKTKSNEIEVPENNILNAVSEPVKRRKGVMPKYDFTNKRVTTEYADSYGFEVTELSHEEQINEIEEKKRRSGLICDLCGKRLTNSYCMKRHKYFHVPKPKSFVCELCSWVFTNKGMLLRHMLQHRFKFSCRSCDFKTNRCLSLKSHLEFHNGKKYTCKYCNKVSGKVSTHLTHVRTTHKSELPWCDLCGEAFIGEIGVDTHKKFTHNILEQYPFKCECDKSFRSQDALDRHVLVEGCGLPSCVQCGESLPSPSLLKHHLTQRHVGGALPAARQCAVCVSRFYSQEALQRHQCGGVACAVCGESFHDTKTLVDHFELLHSNKFECEECGRVYGGKSYREHRRMEICRDRPPKPQKAHNTHNPKNPKNRRTAPKEKKVRKYRVVGGQVREEAPRPPRPSAPSPRVSLVCELCGKGFKYECHLKLHSCPFAERTLACRVCGKLFKTEMALHNHETTTHSEERSFLCSRCPAAFKTISGLYRHQLSHTGERKHLCTICGKRFITSTCVITHIKTMHMKEPPRLSRKRKLQMDRKKNKS